ncbi:hypothetical protein [Actinoplanes sp. NPDC049599]|uniref:hypothetical protein n=1 Tax=Actinoplanes sp. NPDC049599 TaxID=3363903 RepID=UPI0037A4332D
MVSLRAGAGAAVLTGALRGLLRGLPLVVGCVLAGDLLAVVLVLPSALLGVAPGIPITVGLLLLSGYAVRKIFLARRGPDGRQRKRSRAPHPEPRRPRHRVGYRQAAAELGFFGYAGGILVAHIMVVVAVNAWPDRVKALPLPVLFAALLAVCLAGFGGVVLYRVHLHDRLGERRLRHPHRRPAHGWSRGSGPSADGVGDYADSGAADGGD